MSFNARALRDALGNFATGVALGTAREAGGRAIGITIDSFGSVSLDPSLVLRSLARSASDLKHPALGVRHPIHTWRMIRRRWPNAAPAG